MTRSKLFKTAAASIFAATLLGAPVLAGGVGHTGGSHGSGGYQSGGGGAQSGGGTYHGDGGVGVQVGVPDPNIPPLLFGEIELGQNPVTHNPSPNVPGINYNPNEVTHEPSPVVPGIDLNPQGVTHNPSPVVPGINYDPIGVIHNPSPVLPGINYNPQNVTHNPSPVLPGIDLGMTSVTHTPNVPLPNLNVGFNSADINIPINLPNLNIDIQGMITNVNGGGGGCRRSCHRCCGGGNTNIEINIHREHNETNNFYYRGGNSYTYIENREPTYIELYHDEVTLAHAGFVPLRAVCLDNAGGVHPASQVFPETDVDDDYSGEIYRCVIGTYMQYTMGEMENGERVWDGAWTETCAAGEALRYSNGELTCAPQEERRPCNERSLLRRFGPGEKVVRLNGMEMQATTSYGSLGLDGGVGSYRRY